MFMRDVGVKFSCNSLSGVGVCDLAAQNELESVTTFFSERVVWIGITFSLNNLMEFTSEASWAPLFFER